MNERENPANEPEHAPKVSEETSGPTDVPSESVEHQDLVTAYSRRSRRAAGAPSADQQAQPFRTNLPATDAPQREFRVRDFRPESTTAESTTTQPGGETEDDGQLSYRTQASPPGVRQSPPKAVVDSVPPELAAPPRPMTRRELRELEARQGLRPQADDGPAVEPAVIRQPESAPEAAAPAPAPTPAAPAAPTPASAPAPAAPVASETEAAPAEPERPTPPAAPTPQPVVVRLAPPIPVPPPAAPAPAAQSETPPVASPEPVVFTDASGAPPANRAPVVPRPVRPAEAVPQQTAGSLAINRGIDSAPEIFNAPDAHWQTQTNVDAANQSDDAFIRRVGSTGGALTTNALVIPSIPQASDITRPFSSTGEILVTGSIDLPMTLGSTGANPARYDHSDIDALFAQEDHDYAPADAAPVRAIRAVSTHTSTHGVISAKKPANNRLPMMMAVTAGILAVSVAALFAAALIFGYL